jgi:hypothetical protein
MRDLCRTRLAEKMRSERPMYVCTVGGLTVCVGTLTIEEGRHMVRQSDGDERAKTERLPKRLEEKDSKMWVDAATKIARAWQKEGKLRLLLYIVDAYGKG